MSHHPERTARNVRPVNQPPSFFFVLDRINRIDRIKSVGERILEHVHFSSLPLGFEILP